MSIESWDDRSVA